MSWGKRSKSHTHTHNRLSTASCRHAYVKCRGRVNVCFCVSIGLTDFRGIGIWPQERMQHREGHHVFTFLHSCTIEKILPHVFKNVFKMSCMVFEGFIWKWFIFRVTEKPGFRNWEYVPYSGSINTYSLCKQGNSFALYLYKDPSAVGRFESVSALWDMASVPETSYKINN